MWQQVIAIVMLGLGIAKPVQQGRVAGLADTKPSFTTQSTTSNTASGAGFVSRELENRRQKAKESFKTERENFKKKLETFKDQKKKERVETLGTKLDDVNKKRTDQMMIFLNKVIEVLAKIKIQTAAEKAKGKDVSKVTTAIDAAQTAIDVAKAAIEAQAGKSYVISVSSEANVRGDVGTTMKSLERDASSVRDLVNAAKKRVSDAIRELAKIRGEAVINRGEQTGATSSGGR
ncbi:hypothetical protein HYV22_03930 [Candidatus Gottesmanbacteria bacterium]|nr:hypothetical protein [Candidatus Gottesmanbacteria bacterium]